MKKGTTGNVHFSAVATDGKTLAASESDKLKDSALRGIEAVRRAAADASPESARRGPGPASTRGEKH